MDKSEAVARIVKGESTATKEAKRLKTSVAAVRGWVRRSSKKAKPEAPKLPDPGPAPDEVPEKPEISKPPVITPDAMEKIGDADQILRESAIAIGIGDPTKAIPPVSPSPSGGEGGAPDQGETTPPPTTPPMDPADFVLFSVRIVNRRAIQFYALKKNKYSDENAKKISAMMELTPDEVAMIRETAPGLAPYLRSAMEHSDALKALMALGTVVDLFGRRMEAVDRLADAPEPKEAKKTPTAGGKVEEKG